LACEEGGREERKSECVVRGARGWPRRRRDGRGWPRGGPGLPTATTNGLAIEAFQILGVATSPEHRGRGYAQAACAALIRRMQAKGAKRCVLFTGRDNLAAQRCYERLGFRTTATYHLAKFAPPARP